jgi:hypothetical protein
MEAPGGLEKDKGPHKKGKKRKAIPALIAPSPKLWKFDILTSCNQAIIPQMPTTTTTTRLVTACPQMPTTTITTCMRLVTACLPAGDQRKHPTYLLIVLPGGPRTIRSQDLDWDFKRGRLKWCHQHPESVDISQRLFLNKFTHHLSYMLHCWVFGVGAR